MDSRRLFIQFVGDPRESSRTTPTKAEKLAYIHNNPVEAGIVDKAEEYLYSSARDYHEGKHVGLLWIEFLD